MALMQQVSTAQALWRGLTMRCPNCGTGKLFDRFLKVVGHCSVCGEELHHHRADDFPAYIVIFLVGHTMVPAALAFEIDYAPPMWLHFLIWLPLMTISWRFCSPRREWSSPCNGSSECTASRRRNCGASPSPIEEGTMASTRQYSLTRRGFCLCCIGSATFAATGGWLTPRQVFAEARNIVDLFRDEAAKARIKVHKLRGNVSILE